jgi:uncharacterized protein (DUF2126 family)
VFSYRKTLPIWCLLLFHSPDGSPIWIASAAISIIKPAPPQDHVAKGTRTIIFTSTGKNFGISESNDAVAGIIKACGR